MQKSLSYALYAAVLALGAPLGWLILRTAGGHVAAMGPELAISPGLYAYLLIGPLVAFVVSGFLLGRASDRLRAANHALEELSLTDPLTALRNARYFKERLASESERARRESTSFAIVMVDLDHFKEVNDKWGHEVGNLVLRHTAKIMLDNIRAGDVVCRVGGEEFMVVCPSASIDDGFGTAERIRLALVNSPFHNSEVTVNVTASFGVAQHVPGSPPQEVVDQADSALYAAKRGGRNRVNKAS